MFNHFKGILVEKTPAYIVVECSGVGYMLNISLNAFSKLPETQQEVKILSYFAVREDAHVLYGFVDEAERQLFLKLITVSGVGANTARMMLSALNPTELIQAITNSDVATLKRIKGIGLKTAERIIVDLRDKLDLNITSETEDKLFAPSNILKQEALFALTTLGFPKSLAEKAVEAELKENKDTSIQVEDLIKNCLKRL